uniref:COMM domain-containing protein n=1 Tax=Gadus morhua TaxID=8049 RepID=A0A8C4Z441_GADMO
MAAPFDEQFFVSLELLLKSPSKDALRELFSQSYQQVALEGGRLAQRTAEDLDIPFAQLLQCLHSLAHHVVFRGLTRPQQIQDLFPASFHASLKNLITKILLELSPAWRSEAIQTHISLPQLKAFDWRVDMVTSSDSVSRMAVPSCLLTNTSLKASMCVCLGEDRVVVESSRETLDTMLDGLGRLRQQLALVAGK